VVAKTSLERIFQRYAMRGEPYLRRYAKYIGALALALLVGIGFRAYPPTAQPTDDPAFAPDRILVKAKEEATSDSLESLNRTNSARVIARIPGTGVKVVRLPESLSVPEAVERYEASLAVEYAEPDYVLRPALSATTPNDAGFPKMYGLYNGGQYGGTFDADIDGLEAWEATTGSTDTVVAVIDTGVDINHQDLKHNVWKNPGESGSGKETNGVDDDGNGYVDDVHGWDFFNDDASVFDDARYDAHGTHVAGTIAAVGNNGSGIAGVNWEVKIMPLKFIGPNDASYVEDAVAAINYAVDNGVKISNDSWGYDFSSETLERAIADADRAGHLMVTAAMNGGADFVGDDIDFYPMYPASYDDPNIISVAASNNDDELTTFSNYGATSVDLAAPGKDILSTLPGNRYGIGQGTSVAAPYVTGVAALIKSQSPQLSDEAIKARILESVDKKASLQSKVTTGGRLNAAKALGANTGPVIVDLRPKGQVRDHSPTITATVRDDETELTEAQIQLYVDGRLKESFTYDQVSDTLTYETRKLALRSHAIRIEVQDTERLEESRTWRFTVVNRQ